MDRGLRIRFILFMLSVVFLLLTFALKDFDFSGVRKVVNQMEGAPEAPETEDALPQDSSALLKSPDPHLPMQVSGLMGRDLIDEGFKDNTNDWPLTDNSEAAVKIGGKALTVTNKKNSWYIVAKTLEYTDEDTIQVEAEFRMTTGDSAADFGLVWNALDMNNANMFVTNAPGKCRVGFIDNSKRTDIESANAPSVRAGIRSNKLKIVKMGSRLDFYVNDTPVILGSRTGQYYGNSIGFVVFARNTIEVRSFRVSKYSKP